MQTIDSPNAMNSQYSGLRLGSSNEDTACKNAPTHHVNESAELRLTNAPPMQSYAAIITQKGWSLCHPMVFLVYI